MDILVPNPFSAWIERVGRVDYGKDDSRSIKTLYGVEEDDLFFSVQHAVKAGGLCERTIIWTPDRFRPLVFQHPGLGWAKVDIFSPSSALRVLLDFPDPYEALHTSRFHDLLSALQDARQIHRSILVMES